MKRRTLRSTLLRHWLSFAFLTGLAAIVTAGCVAYVVEDRLIDQRVQETLASLTINASRADQLPPGFMLYQAARVPAEVQHALEGRKPEEIAEFQLSDGAYVHAVALERAGRRQFLVFDASDTLVVQPIALVASLMALASLMIFVAIAALVANTLGRRIEKGSERLLWKLQECATPQEVALLAERQEISEMQAFLATHAQVWERRIRAVQEQEETVSFLAHELRTPLQSARASIALLRDEVHESPALDRLERAIARLARASHATLFIGAETEVCGQTELSVFHIWNDLRTEVTPLAQKRGLHIEKAAGTEPHVVAPRHAVEAVLANLLGNAISHGAPGAIHLLGDAESLAIRNRVAEDPTPGFGLGLTIVQRLIARLGWTMESFTKDSNFEVRILTDAEGRP